MTAAPALLTTDGAWVSNFVVLDYDGVIGCLNEHGGAKLPFGTAAVRNLNDLCARWTAAIVPSSSWRWSSRLPGDDGPEDAAATRFFRAYGVTAPLVAGEGWAVPELWRFHEEGMAVARKVRARHGVVLPPKRADEQAWRGDEVQTWFDLFAPWAGPENWLALDDEDDYWPGQMARLVRCRPGLGYDDAAHAQALALLAAPADA